MEMLLYAEITTRARGSKRKAQIWAQPLHGREGAMCITRFLLVVVIKAVPPKENACGKSALSPFTTPWYNAGVQDGESQDCALREINVAFR